MPESLLDRRWPWVAAAAALVLLLLSTLVEVRMGADGDRRPLGSVDDIAALSQRSDTNVLFLLIDTLRADRLGSYGYPRDTSPTLDRLVATGARFDAHLAQSSWTKASMASLWTGMYPARTGITRFNHVVPEEAQMAAEILKEAGFATAGVWRNGWVAPTFGFEQGFDVYTRPLPRPVDPSVQRANPTIKHRGSDEDAVSAAIEFLRIHGKQRWFLYLHFMDLHEYMYDQESALFGGTYSDIYDNSIRWTDGTLALLVAHLEDMGLSENTLIVIASDHGEAFRERGLEGHARRVYRETTEVPFFLVFPFRLASPLVVESRSRNVDIWPTVFDLLGLEALPDVDGRSLLPDLLAAGRGEPAPEADRTAIAHLDQTWGQRGRAPDPAVSVAEGPLRYVRGGEPGQPTEELFDATDDAGELIDRSQEDPETLARLRGVADAYLEETPHWGSAPTREMDELELNHLRALGYAIP